MKINEYQVMSDCVEQGVAYGYQRAHKYSDNPSDDIIRDEIEIAVKIQICEYFKFGDYYE